MKLQSLGKMELYREREREKVIAY